MRHFRPVTVKQVVELTCDDCGLRVNREDDIVEFQEFLQISFSAGYGSVFADGDRYELDLCQHCVKARLGELLRKTGTDFF